MSGLCLLYGEGTLQIGRLWLGGRGRIAAARGGRDTHTHPTAITLARGHLESQATVAASCAIHVLLEFCNLSSADCMQALPSRKDSALVSLDYNSVD